MQGNRTGDKSELEIAFPVRTHDQLLCFWVYACEAVCKDTDAPFNALAP